MNRQIAIIDHQLELETPIINCFEEKGIEAACDSSWDDFISARCIDVDRTDSQKRKIFIGALFNPASSEELEEYLERLAQQKYNGMRIAFIGEKPERYDGIAYRVFTYKNPPEEIVYYFTQGIYLPAKRKMKIPR